METQNLEQIEINIPESEQNLTENRPKRSKRPPPIKIRDPDVNWKDLSQRLEFHNILKFETKRKNNIYEIQTYDIDTYKKINKLLIERNIVSYRCPARG